MIDTIRLLLDQSKREGRKGVKLRNGIALSVDREEDKVLVKIGCQHKIIGQRLLAVYPSEAQIRKIRTALSRIIGPYVTVSDIGWSHMVNFKESEIKGTEEAVLYIIRTLSFIDPLQQKLINEENYDH